MKHETVQDYYGKVLQSSKDLKTSACCDADAPPAALRPMFAKIHPDVLAKYYGCGLTVPAALEGASVLDLGCGSGRDVYLISQLVGAKGRVVGVDMTEEQLAVAEAHRDWHREAFGHCCSNTRFLKGYIEELGSLPLEPASFDVIVSNCVINLSVDKPAVLAGVWNLLKQGGEFYFSDVYCDRRLPEAVRADPLLYGECLGGALYWGDFLHLAREAGFIDPRLVGSRPLAIEDEAVAAKLGSARFFSATYRLFKLDGLEPTCEDYGQAVIYKGGVAGEDDVFVLDEAHRIERGRAFPVCGNSFRMLQMSRFQPYFDFVGDFTQHFGVFTGCGTGMPFGAERADSSGTGSACC